MNLTTLPNSSQIGNVSNGFYVYKYGNYNTVLAAGATCTNPPSVTFEEDTAGSDATSSIVVSTTRLPSSWDADLICQGP